MIVRYDDASETQGWGPDGFAGGAGRNAPWADEAEEALAVAGAEE